VLHSQRFRSVPLPLAATSSPRRVVVGHRPTRKLVEFGGLILSEGRSLKRNSLFDFIFKIKLCMTHGHTTTNRLREKTSMISQASSMLRPPSTSAALHSPLGLRHAAVSLICDRPTTSRLSERGRRTIFSSRYYKGGRVGSSNTDHPWSSVLTSHKNADTFRICIARGMT
jgi:hypothetical protein